MKITVVKHGERTPGTQWSCPWFIDISAQSAGERK